MSAELDDTENLVVNSTENVFADLNLPCSEEDMLKVQIARIIVATLRKRELTQVEAAKLIGADQGKVSALLRGRLKGFSVARLFRFLVLLGRDVDIHISRRYKGQTGRIKVVNAA